MKNIFFPISFVLLIHLHVIFAAGPLCADITCPASHLCCDDVTLGGLCYDATIFSCPVGSSGSILCGFQEHGADCACGLICYDAAEYQCCNNALYELSDTSAPCALPPPTCATTTCPAGDACCDDVRLGPTCYDTTRFTCPSGSSGPILCGNQEHGPDAACGLICYDSTDYVCCDGALFGVGDASIPCATPAPTLPATPAPTTPAPTIPATPAPTTPAPTQPKPTCATTVCIAGQACCDDVRLGPTCYDTSVYTCPSGSAGPILCGNQEHGPDAACGLICYDSTDYVCCNGALYGVRDTHIPCATPAPTLPATPAPTTPAPTQPRPTCARTVCAAGEACCDDVRLGPTCYDARLYTCPSGSAGPILCGNQEHGPDQACGLVCYDATDYRCCENTLYGAHAANLPASC